MVDSRSDLRMKRSQAYLIPGVRNSVWKKDEISRDKCPIIVSDTFKVRERDLILCIFEMRSIRAWKTEI